LTEATLTSRPALLAHEFLGDVELEQGHAAEALKHYDEVWPRALALAPKGDIVAELRRRRAEAFLLLERRGDAYAEAKAALEHCRTLGDRYEEAATYRVLALAAAAMGKPAEAQDWFDQGFAMFADIETPYEWGKLWMAYGDWVSPENPAKARDAYSNAERLWEAMGAKAKLAEVHARLEAVGARLAPPSESTVTTAPSGTAGPRRTARPTTGLPRRSEWALEHFGIVTRSPHVLDLLEQTGRLALRNIPILVLGESGVGKELVAHGIHKLSGRPGSFVPINCGGIPRELVESEMFGHTRGSFTGAQADKPGLFEQAVNGTVFLDEVAEMPAEAQTRLLRFLESGEVRRVGQTAHRIIDVRIVAATNRSREDLEAGDRFRHDLYYRLGNANITLPPLRQRGEDVGLLLEHFWRKACEVENDPPRLSPEAKRKMESYSWPGNIRQLKHVVTRIVATANPGSVVQADDIYLEGPRVAGSLAEAIEDQERQRITEALQAVHGSRTEAARLLGMARTTLLGKMKRYGMMP
jgi:transcriptional regulator with AAA-type ATPase domain